ncbi:hypothetical protein NE237_010574 [Protea cynaroides]|uniref:Fatty acyl-CoA reductase n=1 Tax=Protea cynaroides TaxID=273540 RepID=A0A9Q0L0M7_9MAGN|nr:hypothetical protein NE237_010574 [Protea cynaroides]
MGVLFLNPTCTVVSKFPRSTDRCGWCRISTRYSWKNKKKNSVYFQSNGNVTTSGGLSSLWTKRLMLTPTIGKIDRGSCLVNAGSMDLSSNEKTEDEILEKDDGIGILKFLRGKQFFITGATGFLAKVLIEKILRTMPDVGKIFLLIKSPNKDDAMDRLKNEIINEELFKCLQEIHGKSYQSFMLSKLVPVVGNICESNIGMEEDIAEFVAGEVDIIINSAANTTFDERYDVALNINTKGASRLISFAKSCKKLKLFLQVSTAYVNGERQGRILEKAFCMGDSIARETITSMAPSTSLPLLDVEGEIKLAFDSKEAFQDHAVAQKMKELGLERARVHGWQDTYVFTKAMGEMLINYQRGDIPAIIIRPSVIESTYSEPFPGWIEGNRMMDPIILYYGKGQLTGFLADPKGVLDVVPADMVVNATLAAMAKHGEAGKPAEMKIYQVASSIVNPLEFQDLVRFSYEHFSSSPYMDSKGRPIHVPRSKLFSSMNDFSNYLRGEAIQRSKQVVAAAYSEKLSRKLETASKKSMEQVKYLANLYESYTFYRGRFDITNTQKLMEELSKEEKKSFGFDVRSIDWQHYIKKIHIPGLRKHIMKGRGMPGY